MDVNIFADEMDHLSKYYIYIYFFDFFNLLPSYAIENNKIKIINTHTTLQLYYITILYFYFLRYDEFDDDILLCG